MVCVALGVCPWAPEPLSTSSQELNVCLSSVQTSPEMVGGLGLRICGMTSYSLSLPLCPSFSASDCVCSRQENVGCRFLSLVFLEAQFLAQCCVYEALWPVSTGGCLVSVSHLR